MVMTIREVAEMLKISPKTTYKLISSGELPHVRVRGMIRVPTDAVVTYIKEKVEKREK